MKTDPLAELADSASDLFRDGDGAHLDDALIEARVSAGEGFGPAELAHLAACTECRTVLALAAQATAEPGEVLPFTAPAPRRRGNRSLGWLAAAVVVVGAGLATWRLVPAESGYTHKGSAGELSPEVTFLATDTNGARRDVRERGTVFLDERLGFKYGNPAGRHRTLTVLGWDGERIHWYYPEAEGGAPFQVESGAMAVRLPFDIALRPDHRPGRLTVVGAFDVDPAALAAELRSGETPRGASAVSVEIEEGR